MAHDIIRRGASCALVAGLLLDAPLAHAQSAPPDGGVPTSVSPPGPEAAPAAGTPDAGAAPADVSPSASPPPPPPLTTGTTPTWAFVPPPKPIDTSPLRPASAAEAPPDEDGRYEPPSSKRAVRMRTAGAVLTLCGLGAGVMGGGMLAIGVAAEGDTRSARDAKDTLIGAGVAFLIVGGVSALVGAPLWAVGAANSPD